MTVCVNCNEDVELRPMLDVCEKCIDDNENVKVVEQLKERLSGYELISNFSRRHTGSSN